MTPLEIIEELRIARERIHKQYEDNAREMDAKIGEHCGEQRQQQQINTKRIENIGEIYRTRFFTKLGLTTVANKCRELATDFARKLETVVQEIKENNTSRKSRGLNR